MAESVRAWLNPAKLLDHRAPRYAVIAVWADGNPVEISRHHDYELAVIASKSVIAPFVGIVDLDDPERSFGPWPDD